MIGSGGGAGARGSAGLERPESLFLALSLFFGVLLLLVMPPFHAPDEPSHLFRAWAISEGKFRSEREGGIRGAWIPLSLLRTTQLFFDQTPRQRTLPMDPGLLRRAIRIRLEADERIFIAAPEVPVSPRMSYSAAGYTPVGYLATVPGILIGRTLGAPPILLLYAARLSTLVLTTFLGWLAVARTPFLKWAFAWTLLLPMAVHLRASVNVDGLLITLCFLAVAEILRLLGPESAGSQRLALASAAGMSLIKPGYAIVALLGLAIPPSQLGGRARWARFAASLALVFALGTAVTLLFPRDSKTAPSGSQPAEREARIEAIRDDPVEFASAALSYWLDSLGKHGHEFVGNLGWLDTQVPTWGVVIGLWVMVLLTQIDGMGGARPLVRLWAILLFVGISGVLTLHMHLSSRQGAWMEGVQGRYFLPIVPLLLVAIGWRMPLMRRLTRPGLLVAILAMALLAASLVVAIELRWK